MHRRTFLSSAMGAAAAFATPLLRAQHTAHHSMPAAHRGMHSASMPTPNASLAAIHALPTGLRHRKQLPKLINQSQTPGVFHAELIAQPIQTVLIPRVESTLWSYGDDPVGPLIDVQEGDTLIIRFINRLPQASTIHWHGLPVPSAEDGNPHDLVAPGHTRVYRFTLPTGSAGTYWYHPHPYPNTSEQVFRGLAGPIIVRAADDPLADLPERHLFMTDLKLAADGVVAPNDMMDWMNGREGQFVLINGQHRPRLSVRQTERWRIWNACSARYLRLTLAGRKFTQAGTDGGLLETPRSGLTELLLAPAERAEIIVYPSSQGARVQLASDVYDRRKMSMSHGHLPPAPLLPLAEVTFAPGVPARLPTRLRSIERLGEAKARKRLVLTERMDMAAMHQSNDQSDGRPRGMEFLINGKTFNPNRVDFISRRNETELWEIDNRSDMDHPFHLHGVQFQVVERVRDGQRAQEPYLAWRDTVNVRPNENVKVKVVQSSEGIRMFHCHILEHEDLGMMGHVQIIA